MKLHRYRNNYTRTITLFITDLCPLQCKHCFVNAKFAKSPQDVCDIEMFIETTDEYRKHTDLRTIGVTGGEPFYTKTSLKRLSDYCRQTSLFLEVITSGYWANTQSEALDMLSYYDGITHVTFSTDRFHIQEVPIDSIRHGYLAAKEKGLSSRIKIAGETPDSLREHPVLSQILGMVTSKKDVQFQEIALYGRASKLKKIKTPKIKVCEAVTPVVKIDGTIAPCCSYLVELDKSTPLHMGNFFHDEAREIYRHIKTNWLLYSIRMSGFNAIIDALQRQDLLPPTVLANDKNMCMCTTCYQIFADSKTHDFLQDFSRKLAFRLGNQSLHGIAVDEAIQYQLKREKRIRYS